MQDIDFEELDRAVSSTMGPSDETPEEQRVKISTQPPEIKTVSTPAARRSSGRFMDVVHPSSDMRNSSSERSAPRVSEPVPAREPEPAPERDTSTDWPDPLDFHGFTDEEPKKDEPTNEPESTEEPSDGETQPLESPFLTDAKVEKRPLGAFSDNEPTPTISDELAKAEDTPTDEPELLLEASDEPLLEATNEPEERKEEDTGESEAPEVTEATVTETETPAPKEDIPTGPTSITQQYKEQPSTTSQPSGAIYDTEAYHQPLAYPAKKKSGGLVILWILGLIIIGGGIGAAVYFFVLPML
ncbi:MAG: hypothetical protein JWM52_252 [Candidatus Saccharibacteria bacterium]|nr:hypothetical protein [Candidatus Saccharibacteria bacterium]